MAEEEKQKLGKWITPWDAAQVPCSVADGLNRGERVASVSIGVKTFPNSAYEQERSGKSGQDVRVPVSNMRGEPLMPTTARKARKFLEQGKAKVVGYNPFTIQLLYGTGETKQEIVLGVDAGYAHIGYSAVTAKEELISGELELRTDIKRLLDKRRAYRRTKRNRLWYRKPRFLNRGKEGWLAPSIKHKLKSHIKLIERLNSIIPITKIVVEVASFDTQKMQNHEITGIEYQQGTLQGYNVRNYLLEKWKRKCAYCGQANVPLEVEHIIPKSRGGSDRVSNLTIACHKCNDEKGTQTAAEFGRLGIQNKAKKPLKSAAFMNIIRWKVVDHFKCKWTYGHKTKYGRIKAGLDKSHINDAFIIAGGKTQKHTGKNIIEKQVRRQNRSLYKANIQKGGMLKRNTVKEVKEFRRFDKVEYKNKEFFIFGLRSSGYFNLKNIEGEKVTDSVSLKKLTFIERARGKIAEVRRAIPPCAEAHSLLASG
ncbi:MAG: HNH endonuclease [Methanosarcinales archaeon]|nr:MAG: HNH endonuclease [Methanosarcinales archaeon]